MLSIMLVILSCKTATTPINQERDGTYISAKPVNSSSYLTFMYSSGGFKLYYSDAKGTLPEGGKENTATADNISGEDPNYNFQTGVMAGSLQFISSDIVKITVTFNDGPTTLKDILCYKNTGTATTASL